MTKQPKPILVQPQTVEGFYFDWEWVDRLKILMRCGQDEKIKKLLLKEAGCGATDGACYVYLRAAKQFLGGKSISTALLFGRRVGFPDIQPHHFFRYRAPC
jgi:hypothetical protein